MIMKGENLENLSGRRETTSAEENWCLYILDHFLLSLILFQHLIFSFQVLFFQNTQ